MHEGARLRFLGMMLLLAGLGAAAGCRGCQEAPPPADAGPQAAAADGAAAAPEPAPVSPAPGVAPAGEQDAFGKRYEPPTDAPQPMESGKPMRLVPLPAVSDEEIDNDPALSKNPNLPPGTKRTLKVLQKLTQTDPRFDPKRNPGDPTAEPPSDNVKKGPAKAP
ncbi:MAG TPA: hypothetical protein PK668_19275 [Myxococcota bacterium]|nr:hypothetical protein [Myxococcota bacterium]HRY95127.1 hypothetical protein [Myxococcota bacterium]